MKVGSAENQGACPRLGEGTGGDSAGTGHRQNGAGGVHVKSAGRCSREGEIAIRGGGVTGVAERAAAQYEIGCRGSGLAKIARHAAVSDGGHG